MPPRRYDGIWSVVWLNLYWIFVGADTLLEIVVPNWIAPDCDYRCPDAVSELAATEDGYGVCWSLCYIDLPWRWSREARV